jgi:hypothetical protein
MPPQGRHGGNDPQGGTEGTAGDSIGRPRLSRIVERSFHRGETVVTHCFLVFVQRWRQLNFAVGDGDQLTVQQVSVAERRVSADAGHWCHVVDGVTE